MLTLLRIPLRILNFAKQSCNHQTWVLLLIAQVPSGNGRAAAALCIHVRLRSQVHRQAIVLCAGSSGHAALTWSVSCDRGCAEACRGLS
jgi:hypothetical protein